jgi:hypothetical protein
MRLSILMKFTNPAYAVYLDLVAIIAGIDVLSLGREVGVVQSIKSTGGFLFVDLADEVASLPSCSTNEGQTCDLQHPRAREYLWQVAQKLMAQEPECR